MRAVVIPTALTLLVLAGIVGGVLQFSTARTDEIAASMQRHRVRVAVIEGIKAVGVDQEASTYWDDAVLRTRERPLDEEWVDNNLGVWFHTYYGVDEAYLLDAGDAPIYAMRDGRRAQPAEFRRVAAPALALAAQLRRQLAVSRLPAAGSREKTAGASAIAVVSGRPALVSVKPIVSETGKITQAHGSEYLHVVIRYLDGSFLDHIAKLHVVDQPRFSWASLPGPNVEVRALDGRKRGYISWKPFQPGKEVAREMLPVLLGALLIIGALVSLLLWRIQRSREELEASRADAQRIAFHDSLTGLPNRTLFEDRLNLALSRRGSRAAVLLLDLDRFKNVNDTLGHQAGDIVIREFAQRLARLIRQSDTVARFGGDEFAVLVEAAPLADIRRLARRILDDVRRPFPLFGAEVYVGVSIGVATSSGSCSDATELVRKADIALYSAKDGGRNTYRLFSPEMDKNVQLRSTIEDELRTAMRTGVGLVLHYQPEVGRAGRIVGVEALLRWEHPKRGLLLPARFVSVAEETGLIVALGEWVLREACQASLRWPQLYVAINLSPVQFRAPDFLNRLTRIVAETGANPANIQLEVTERVLLDDDCGVRRILSELRAAGFGIVLDDFGTGYSSLSYLRKFKIDKIKIDGSFVKHLGDEPDSAAIVTAVLALGRALGLTVAAEGVETVDQRTFLEIGGCDEMQGHLFSRAVPRDEIATLLAAGGAVAAAA